MWREKEGDGTGEERRGEERRGEGGVSLQDEANSQKIGFSRAAGARTVARTEREGGERMVMEV